MILKEINVGFCLSDLKIYGCSRMKVAENNNEVIKTSC